MTDHDHRPTGSHAPVCTTSAEFWEERYAGADQVWSARVNQALADVAGRLVPGRALDLGLYSSAEKVRIRPTTSAVCSAS